MENETQSRIVKDMQQLIIALVVLSSAVALAGEPVRIHLRQADLYAFWIENSP